VEGSGGHLFVQLDALSSFPSASAATVFEPVLVLPDDADTCQVSWNGIPNHQVVDNPTSNRAAMTSKASDDRSDEEDEEDNAKED